MVFSTHFPDVPGVFAGKLDSAASQHRVWGRTKDGVNKNYWKNKKITLRGH